MLKGYKKIFFLGISVLYSFSCPAQFIDDIPLFDDTSPKVAAETPEKTASSEQSKDEQSEPDLGRTAKPRNRIIITPPPLPEVGFALQNEPSVPKIPAEASPTPVVNSRQESIYLPPTDKTEAGISLPPKMTSVHDVHQFDIEGFYLGMQPKAVLQIALQKGYKLQKSKKALPLFQTSYYEILCRRQGIYNPSNIRACIRQMGQKNRQDYIEEMVLVKPGTHEMFDIKFTSYATDNEAYQIIYANKGDNSLNFTPVNLAKKLNRKEAFFNAVFSRYGYPDDSNQLIWGTKEDAYMQVTMAGSAYDAIIKLVDRNLSDADYFEAVDWKENQKTLYHFGFDE